ncbi:MAG: HD domain-containing protein [Methanoregula sp.]|nr:HD domain-containing protein [Methanoregula sp.]
MAIDYEHGNIPAWVYMNHPLRVASMIARVAPEVSEETLVVALLHNVLEVSKITYEEIQNLFGEPVALALRALTIDRKRKDQSYLKVYYSRIEAAPVGCAMVKVADKLDNIYMICFNPSQITRVSYLDEIDEWVIPLASRVVPQLVTRLEEASTVMRELGFLNRDTELEMAKKDATL